MDHNVSPSLKESHPGNTESEESEMNGPPSQRKDLCTKASMMIMMVEHDDSDDEDESPEELDQATMSSLCSLPAEIALSQQARQLSELSIKEALAEEFIEIETRRMSLISIHSAFSAAIMYQSDDSRQKKRKPNIFRRFFSCCISCTGRRNQ
ncbi:uncharacterized protein LOC133179286 [Saccostrea echinata]|uniref:uncharacterized protein LOC133179286 n=1 Tax=Saccostrea echinata TaxID=191078 RepID=UPI002A83A33B|nr:uncharacterized protein LOC133179286 [Saccostrea echinata]